MILVDAATADDVAALAELAAATFPLASPAHVTPSALQEYIDSHLRPASFAGYLDSPDRTVLVARDTGAGDPDRLVGYSMTVQNEPPDAITALRPGPVRELNKIYVRPDAHGTGLARTLLGHTLEVARGAGLAALWLGTNQENVRAQTFYLKNGFEQVGTRQFLLGGRLEDDFVYLYQFTTAQEHAL